MHRFVSSRLKVATLLYREFPIVAQKAIEVLMLGGLEEEVKVCSESRKSGSTKVPQLQRHYRNLWLPETVTQTQTRGNSLFSPLGINSEWEHPHVFLENLCHRASCLLICLVTLRG